MVAGRMADPSRPDEVVMTAAAARLLGVHVGSTMPLGLYTAAQMNNVLSPESRGSCHTAGSTSTCRRSGRREHRSHTRPNRSVSDLSPYTPALTHELLTPPLLGGEGRTDYGLQLDHGDADVTTVEREINKRVPTGTLVLYHVTSTVETEAQRAIAPEVIALWTFGLIATLATLLVVLQAVSRQLQTQSEEREVLRALGGDTWMTAADGLIGIVGSIVAGSILAVVVAIALSPLSPIRSCPARVSGPWNLLRLVGTWSRNGIVHRQSRRRIRGALHPQQPRPSRQKSLIPCHIALLSLCGLLAASGLPVSAVAGSLFALAPGTWQVVRSNPFSHVRSAGGRSHGGLHPYIRQQPADIGGTTQTSTGGTGPMP